MFLDDVRVPATDLVGGLNQGWTIAKALLSFERIFLDSPKQSQYALQRLAEIGRATGRFDDPVFRDQFTRLKLNVQDLESTFKRFADVVRRGEPLGPDVSMLKIWATETFARVSDMLVETAGESGAMTGKLPFGDIEVDVLTQFYNARPATIYAGSNEIQRNILAKHALRPQQGVVCVSLPAGKHTPPPPTTRHGSDRRQTYRSDECDRRRVTADPRLDLAYREQQQAETDNGHANRVGVHLKDRRLRPGGKRDHRCGDRKARASERV